MIDHRSMRGLARRAALVVCVFIALGVVVSAQGRGGMSSGADTDNTPVVLTTVIMPNIPKVDHDLEQLNKALTFTTDQRERVMEILTTRNQRIEDLIKQYKTLKKQREDQQKAKPAAGQNQPGTPQVVLSEQQVEQQARAIMQRIRGEVDTGILALLTDTQKTAYAAWKTKQAKSIAEDEAEEFLPRSSTGPDTSMGVSGGGGGRGGGGGGMGGGSSMGDMTGGMATDTPSIQMPQISKVDKDLKQLTKALDLTTDQQQQVRDVLASRNQKIEDLVKHFQAEQKQRSDVQKASRGAGSGPGGMPAGGFDPRAMDQAREDLRSIRSEADTKIAALLTDSQKTAYEGWKAKRSKSDAEQEAQEFRPSANGGMGGGGMGDGPGGGGMGRGPGI